MASSLAKGDLATQARQVFSNLGRALAAAGARTEQVVKINIYVVNYTRDECLPVIENARVALFGDHKPGGRIQSRRDNRQRKWTPRRTSP
jgi:enamine deaminase RidA (YjgF/YER057c/UK114 family)